MIEPCTTPAHAGWLALRRALWPHHDDRVHLAEMAAFCAAPERFAQFIAYAAPGTPHGLVEVALRHDYVNGTRSSPVAFRKAL
jgi:aminoglycoside 6'-N-acetyltransferase I